MKKKIRLLFGLAALLCLSLCTTVFANSNGEHVNKDNSSKSYVLCIGDSRTLGLAECDKQNFAGKNEPVFSYHATVGAHYVNNKCWVTGKWKNTPMVINASKYEKQQTAIVKNILKKHGKCIVVICGTDNDGGLKGWASKSADGMVDLYKAIRKVSVNGKKATVYFTNAVPALDEDKDVKDLNKAITKAAGKHGIKVIDLKASSKTWKKYYSGDDDHFKKSGSKKLKQIILAGIGGKAK